MEANVKLARNESVWPKAQNQATNCALERTRNGAAAGCVLVLVSPREASPFRAVQLSRYA